MAPTFKVEPLPPVIPAQRSQILAERDAWARDIEPDFLFHRLFDVIPGLQFFAKNQRGIFMFLNRAGLKRHQTEDESAIIGLNDYDLSTPSLAQSYVSDDAHILETGEPLLNRVELLPDEEGIPDWYVVNKLPIRSRTGEIIGLMGLSQSFQERCKLLSPFQSISKAISHVQLNYQHNGSIHDLAKLAGYSPRQLERKFQDHFGTGPWQFIIRTRLLAACRQLSGTSLGLAEIAAECGFADQSAFTRQFRRHLGATPQQFRLAAAAGRRRHLAPAVCHSAAKRKGIMAQRDAWVREIEPACLFHPLFDTLPGLQFFAKNRQGRMMFMNRGCLEKYREADEMAVIGLTDFELSPLSLAQSYVNDDARIFATGKPLLNHIELVLDEQAMPDWFVVNKMPVRSRSGSIIGIMGFNQPLQEPSHFPTAFPGLSKAVSHMRQNYQQSLSVSGLAQKAGLSVGQLERELKGCFGMGPKQFLLKTRLRAASRQLASTNEDLTRIAARCGFTNPSAFARQFRLHLGLTPREFRRRRQLR